MQLWTHQDEINFFESALKNFATKEQLFYNIDNEYYAYIPKSKQSNGQTLQSRNSLIGKYTETWTQKLFADIARSFGLYAVNGVICDEIGLSNSSNADLAFCTTNQIIQPPENIKLIFEIKMSIVSNYLYDTQLKYVGDYKSHRGNPSLLRSDSMLKAIGKSVNIRVSSLKSCAIPIIILGNSPIGSSYTEKVDHLKSTGIIQGFWSLNTVPCSSDYIKNSPKEAFLTIDTYDQVKSLCSTILNSEQHFFSSMLNNKRLAEIITLAAKEFSEEKIAKKFLELLRKN